MAGTNKTFRDLQDYAVQPPPGLFKKLWNKIRQLETGKHPGKGSHLPDEDHKLASLKSYVSEEEQPPVFDYKKISIAIRNQTVIPSIEKKKPFPLFYKVAAAVLVIGLAGMVYYVVFGNRNNKYSESFSASLSNQTGNNSDSSGTIANNTQGADSANLVSGNTHASGGFSEENGPGFPASIPKGNTGEFYNDFIYYLTNFKEETEKRILEKISNDKKIVISHFSYVAISDKMAAFIKGMSDTNKKGKSSRTARKLKSQLNKWKKKDEAFFDKSIKQNPLDIIDLTDFLLKK